MEESLRERLSVLKTGLVMVATYNWRRIRSLSPGEVTLDEHGVVTICKVGTKKPLKTGELIAADSFFDDENENEAEIEFGICLVLRELEEVGGRRSTLTRSEVQEVSTLLGGELQGQQTSTFALSSANELQGWLQALNGALYARRISKQSLDSTTIKIGNLVGSGAFGQVYRASMNDDEDVAVKFFMNDEIREEFCIESGVLLRAQHHPNVLKFYGVTIFTKGLELSEVTSLQPLALVTEYCPNGTLQSFLEGGGEIDFEFCRNMALGIAKGCGHIHSKGIVHRDLKPENIMLGVGHQPKLVDFGQSRVVALDRTMTADVRGSLLWRAPEIMTGGIGRKVSKITNYGVESDMFSFGIIFWQILSRDEPYKNVLRSWNIVSGVQSGELRPLCLESWPPRIPMLMKWCWSGDPSARPTADEVVAWLGDAAGILATDTKAQSIEDTVSKPTGSPVLRRETISGDAVIESTEHTDNGVLRTYSLHDSPTHTPKAPKLKLLAAIELRSAEKRSDGHKLLSDIPALIVQLRNCRDEGGLELLDRKFFGFTVSKCFTGKHFVELVQDICNCSQAEAIAVGTKLQVCDFISHTIQGTKFSIGCYFYWRPSQIIDRLLLILEETETIRKANDTISNRDNTDRNKEQQQQQQHQHDVEVKTNDLEDSTFEREKRQREERERDIDDHNIPSAMITPSSLHI